MYCWPDLAERDAGDAAGVDSGTEGEAVAVNYYNEIDSFAADWIENLIKEGLIPNGIVDRRSITEVTPDDIRGFTQVHFFAGIAGWSRALRLAGWPDDRPVWTGSCPCQPFSSAGKQKGQSDERHLWPIMFGLIRECRPDTVFGEQVSSAIGHGWLDGICADMEAENYAVGQIVLGAHCVGAPHIRQRLYWVANTTMCGLQRESAIDGQPSEEGSSDSEPGLLRELQNKPKGCCRNDWLANAEAAEGRAGDAGDSGCSRCGRDGSAIGCANDGLEYSESDRRIERGTESSRGSVASGCCEMCPVCCGPAIREGFGVSGTTCDGCRVSGLGQSLDTGLEGHAGNVGRGSEPGRISAESIGSTSAASAWSDYRIIHCTDGKSRRVGREVQPLAHGIPRRMGSGQPELSSLVRRARNNRVGRLKGYGNAIVPQVAADFIRAFMDLELC